MLNETWRVWQALENAKIKIDIPHPLIKPLPTSEKNLLRVRLDENGGVVSVEDIADDERSGIRRIVQTSDGSFPVVKVNQPFLDLPAESTVWDQLGKAKQEIGRISLLDKALAGSTHSSWADAGWKWSNSLEKSNLLVEILSGDDQVGNIVSLAQRFQKALQSKDAVVSEIASVALKQLRTGSLGALKTVQELLVGKGKDNRGKDKKISVLLVLELDKGGSIYQRQVWQSIAAVLPTNLSATERGHKHPSVASAFGGEGGLLMEPFPQVKLPVLGSYFPLVSMASDTDKAKCNKRYGLTEYTVCPVTSAQSRRMAGALKWLVTRDERSTWRGLLAAISRWTRELTRRKRSEIF